MAAHLLRRGNSDLARDGVFTWSIPALTAVSSVTGGLVRTCPSAGICAALCYARRGRYRFPNVLESHTRNLDGYLADPQSWQRQLIAELRSRRFRPSGLARQFPWPIRLSLAWWAQSGGRAVRIHDAGDFFSSAYLRSWVEVAASTPDVLFYAYTKEVAHVKALSFLKLIPPNLVFIFSLGGRQDSLIDLDQDRHDDVFPSLDALLANGYTDQGDSDLMAPLLPTHRIGIVANRMPTLVRRQGLHSFGELQSET